MLPKELLPQESMSSRDTAGAPMLLPGSMSQLMRFGAVGVSNAAISFFAFHAGLLALNGMSAGPGIAQVIGYAAGTAWSFLWNRKFTFRAAGTASRQALRFVLVQAALAASSGFFVWLCVSVAGWAPTPAWITVMIPSTLINFLLCKRWVFAA